MKKTFLILGMAMIVVASLSGMLHSQEDIKALSDPAFGVWRKGAAPFIHDQHNTKAKIADCTACHHLYKNGKLEKGDSAGTKCSECHTLKGDKKAMPLMRAYHRQCENCHASKGVGPVACGECHPKAAVKK